MVETQVPGVQASLSAVVKKNKRIKYILKWRNFCAEKIWRKMAKNENFVRQSNKNTRVKYQKA